MSTENGKNEQYSTIKMVKNVASVLTMVSSLALSASSDASSIDRYAFKSENGDLMAYHYPVFGNMWMSKISNFDDFMANLRTIDPDLYQIIKLETGFTGSGGNFSKLDIDNDGYASAKEINQRLENTNLESRFGSITKILERAANGSDRGAGSASSVGASGSAGSSSSGGGGNSGGQH